MTEGENWLLNISDTETAVGCYGRRHLMYRNIKWCYVFYDVRAPICRQSPKLGFASNSGLDGDSLPARHNDMFMASFSLPAYFCRLSSILYCYGCPLASASRGSQLHPRQCRYLR